jgi:hypothetical protein
VKAGIARCAQVPDPDEGSQRRCSENTRIRMIPRKKFGMEKPKTAKLITPRSMALPWCCAAMTPSGMPMNSAIASPQTPSSSVLGARSITMSQAGSPERREMPKSPVDSACQ